MLEYSTEDAVSALHSSPNLNAAIKNFIKRELQKSDPALKFVKTLRAVFASGDEERMKGFIEKQREVYGQHLIALAGYAYYEFVADVSTKVVKAYAEDFNETYDVSSGEFEFNDQKEFEKIALQAFALMGDEMSSHNIQPTPFMKNVTMNSIFDDAVMEHVVPLAQKNWK